MAFKYHSDLIFNILALIDEVRRRLIAEGLTFILGYLFS